MAELRRSKRLPHLGGAAVLVATTTISSLVRAELPDTPVEVGAVSGSEGIDEEPDAAEDASDSSIAGDSATAGDSAETEPDPQPAPAAATSTPEEDKAASKHVHPEDEDGWISWPFDSSDEGAQGHRWATIGGFAGWVHRPSHSSRIDYRPGLAYGGFLRPELTSWLGLRLFYREERLAVKMKPDAYEVEGEELDLDFTQPDLEIMNLGGRLEPTWVIHPRLRVHGIIGYAWLQMRAPAPKAKNFEIEKTFRTAAQTELTLGVGLSVDVIQDWLGVGVDFAHSFPTTRWGDAYSRHQVVVDGKIRHLSPLPKLRSSNEVLFSVGLIL